MSHPDVVLMSRLDFDVQELDIPPLPDGEVEGLIRYRLRSIYPGTPEETSFDFRLFRQGQGRTRRAFVFIARKATIDGYRESAGRRSLFLPLPLLMPAVPRRGDFRAWVVGTTWAEHLCFHDGAPTSSTVRRLPLGTHFDPATEDDCLHPDAVKGPALIVATTEVLSSLQLPEGARVLTLEALSKKLRKGDGLFLEVGRTRKAPAVLRLSALAAAVVVFCILVLLKYVGSVEAHADALHALTLTLEKSGQNVLALQKEIDGLKVERDRLNARTPRDVYLLLSELSVVLGDHARIQSISIQDDNFQVDALGTNALSLMDGFKARPGFKNMRLAQVVPDPQSGRERFSFSGTFDDH
jgi:hypothetical protein